MTPHFLSHLDIPVNSNIPVPPSGNKDTRLTGINRSVISSEIFAAQF